MLSSRQTIYLDSQNCVILPTSFLKFHCNDQIKEIQILHPRITGLCLGLWKVNDVFSARESRTSLLTVIGLQNRS